MKTTTIPGFLAATAFVILTRQTDAQLSTIPGSISRGLEATDKTTDAKAQKAFKGGKSKAWEGSKCSNPIAAILATLNCVEKANVTCASAGYDSGNFVKLHNDIDTNTTIDESFWQIAFLLLEIDLDINHQMNIGTNQASIRYVEKVSSTDGSSFGLHSSSNYPFGQVLLQYEHALATVDS